jgi:hypothetical protein
MTEASVSFAGNLTDHPELRHTEGGIARAMFRVAVSARRDRGALVHRPGRQRPLGRGGVGDGDDDQDVQLDPSIISDRRTLNGNHPARAKTAHPGRVELPRRDHLGDRSQKPREGHPWPTPSTPLKVDTRPRRRSSGPMTARI